MDYHEDDLATDRHSEEDGYHLLDQKMGQQELPLEIHKLMVVIVLLIIAAFSNWWTLAYVHDFSGRTPLPDILFSIVPEQKWALKVGDMMVTLSGGTMISIFILHKHRAIVVRRILFIIAVLYFMRTLSLISTQLPSGYTHNDQVCREQLRKNDRTFFIYLMRVIEQGIGLGMQNTNGKMLCGDLLFSGHTLIMVVSALTVEYYLPANLRLCQYFPKLFMVVGIVCLIISRTHYTVDVIFAYLMSVGVFSIYHVFSEIDAYRERKNSILYRFWLIRFIGWLESNVVPGKLDNAIELPFQTLYSQIHQRFGSTKQQPPTASSTASTIVIDVP